MANFGRVDNILNTHAHPHLSFMALAVATVLSVGLISPTLLYAQENTPTAPPSFGFGLEHINNIFGFVPNKILNFFTGVFLDDATPNRAVPRPRVPIKTEAEKTVGAPAAPHYKKKIAHRVAAGAVVSTLNPGSDWSSALASADQKLAALKDFVERDEELAARLAARLNGAGLDVSGIFAALENDITQLQGARDAAASLATTNQTAAENSLQENFFSMLGDALIDHQTIQALANSNRTGAYEHELSNAAQAIDNLKNSGADATLPMAEYLFFKSKVAAVRSADSGTLVGAVSEAEAASVHFSESVDATPTLPDPGS